MITIENTQFSAAIRVRGAELASLKSNATEREFIWQADPHVWGGSAPILFPIVGKLKNETTRINGTSYEIPKHGLLRNREATVIEHGPTHAVFQFGSDNQTLERFPFPFIFKATFRLIEKGISIDYEITNNGTETMLFSVGSHPAFALDLERHALSDYSIGFSEPETLDLYGFVDGFLGALEEKHLTEESSLRLRESMFHENALIFQNIKSRTIRLNPAGIEVDIRNHPHLGIWQVPGAPYICIEPWHSFDDSADSDGIFENKPGILLLPTGETFETGYSVRIPR